VIHDLRSSVLQGHDSRFKDILTQDSHRYKNDDDLAWNPLAIYRTVKHLTVDFDDKTKNMLTNSYNGKIHTSHIMSSTSFIELKFDKINFQILQQK